MSRVWPLSSLPFPGRAHVRPGPPFGVTGSMLTLCLGCRDLSVGSEHTLPKTVTHTFQPAVEVMTGSHLPSGSVCHEVLRAVESACLPTRVSSVSKCTLLRAALFSTCKAFHVRNLKD